jgi:protein SCO1
MQRARNQNAATAARGVGVLMISVWVMRQHIVGRECGWVACGIGSGARSRHLAGRRRRRLASVMAEPVETPRRTLTRAVVPAVALAALAGLGALLVVSLDHDRQVSEAPPENCILGGAEQVGGPIELLDSAGAAVTQADFAGAPALVYFGFTHCPDVCPTTLYTLAEALALPGGYDVQSVLISLDPARDTPELMHAYVRTEGFPAGLVGLTGAPDQIAAATGAFRVSAERPPAEGAESVAYAINHSSFLYVMDGQWRTRAIIRTIGASPEQMAQCVSIALKELG